MTYTNSKVQSPTSGIINQASRHSTEELKMKSKGFSSAIASDKSVPMHSSKPLPKEYGGNKKNIGKLNNSHENSPGKLMSNFKSESKVQEVARLDHNKFRSDFSMAKTLDFAEQSRPTDYCQKCKTRMKLENKQNQGIPLTESEKRELNYVQIKMMIFDARYEELQEHGTLPNCFRFSLKERLTDEDVNIFIDKYTCAKQVGDIICIMGASNLTADPDSLNGVEDFHVKAVNKIINKMEKNSFLHVTTLEEGFEKCHELCKLHDLRIQEHSPDHCYYCMKEEEDKEGGGKEGTFKVFAGRFASLYESMGQKFKNFITKGKSNFEVVEDDDNDNDSEANSKPEFSSSFPDFDPSKLENEIEGLDDPTFGRNKSDKNQDMDRLISSQGSDKFPSTFLKKIPTDLTHSRIGPQAKKKMKEFRNRSSEFSTNELNILKPDAILRNSNEIFTSKKNMSNDGKNNPKTRRLYASGYSQSNTHDKIPTQAKVKAMSLSQNCTLSSSVGHSNLKDSMTRKKITTYKVPSKNANMHMAPKPHLMGIKRSSSTIGKNKASPKAQTPQSRKHLSESGKPKI